jgi:hypothetical protein
VLVLGLLVKNFDFDALIQGDSPSSSATPPSGSPLAPTTLEQLGINVAASGSVASLAKGKKKSYVEPVSVCKKVFGLIFHQVLSRALSANLREYLQVTTTQ